MIIFGFVEFIKLFLNPCSNKEMTLFMRHFDLKTTIKGCRTVYNPTWSLEILSVNDVWKAEVAQCDLWRSAVTSHCFLSLSLSESSLRLLLIYRRWRRTGRLSEPQRPSQVQVHQSQTRYTEREGDGDEERQATLAQYNRPLTFPLLSRLLTLKRGALPRNSVSGETTSLRERRRRKKLIDASLHIKNVNSQCIC